MAINKIDYNDTTDVLTGNVTTPFELDSFTSTTIPKLKAGRSEEIGGSLYRVETSDETPTGSPSDGVIYLYVEDPGTGVAAATISATAPTYNPASGGFYNGNGKCTHVCIKSGSTYTGKTTIGAYQAYSMRIISALGKTAFEIDPANSGTDSGLTIGADTNLYRDSANLLKTDDALTVALALKANSLEQTQATGSIKLIEQVTSSTLRSETSPTRRFGFYNIYNGVLSIGFALTASVGTAYGQIYVNASPVGTLRSTTGSNSWNEDVSVSFDDEVAIYSYSSGGGSHFCTNFNAYGDRAGAQMVTQ